MSINEENSRFIIEETVKVWELPIVLCSFYSLFDRKWVNWVRKLIFKYLLKCRMISLVVYSWLVFVGNYELLLKKYMVKSITYLVMPYEFGMENVKIQGAQESSSNNLCIMTRQWRKPCWKNVLKPSMLAI